MVSYPYPYPTGRLGGSNFGLRWFGAKGRWPLEAGKPNFAEIFGNLGVEDISVKQMIWIVFWWEVVWPSESRQEVAIGDIMTNFSFPRLHHCYYDFYFHWNVDLCCTMLRMTRRRSAATHIAHVPSLLLVCLLSDRCFPSTLPPFNWPSGRTPGPPDAYYGGAIPEFQPLNLLTKHFCVYACVVFFPDSLLFTNPVGYFVASPWP